MAPPAIWVCRDIKSEEEVDTGNWLRQHYAASPLPDDTSSGLPEQGGSEQGLPQHCLIAILTSQ